jgi:hypothetical protein
MKSVLFSLAGLCCILLVSCSQSGNKSLFNGKDSSQWTTTGQVAAEDELLTLSGAEARAVLLKGGYKNFCLSLELRTTPGGKGAVWFHTDPALSKGYRVAIQNDRSDPVWWRMSGSLLAVRNLSKSFVKENEWFRLDIRVEGRAIAVDINEYPVVEYIEPAEPYRVGEYANAILSEGTFAIVSEGEGEIQIRNITVSTLDLRDKDIDIQAQLAEAVDEQTDRIIRLHQEDFPVLDYHVHLKGGLTKEEAAKQSRQTGINYAIAPNCGEGFPITDDAGVLNFLNEMRTEPFILAMQAEGRNWPTTFSPEVRNEFDYVFTDAMTFTDSRGRRSRIWIPEETWIENEQQYMDLIVNTICDVLQEPMDIYVNPCFLPLQMQDRYDEFWTESRMDTFIEALVKSGKVLEINARYRIPSQALILKAKARGVKFSFGTNNAEAVVGKLDYCVEMKEACGITAQDMFRPKVKI